MVSFAYSAPEIRVNVLFLRDTASLYAADDREGPPEAFPAPSTEHAAGVDLRADLQDELTAKQPRNKISRQRLSLEEWEAIYTSAEQQQPYLQCGMVLAIVTGQRLGDIYNMNFSDV